MMKPVVFGARASPFCDKVLRAFAAKGVAYTLEPMRSPTSLTRHSPETGKMPTVRFEEEGPPLFDSSRILRELDRRFPDPPLLPDGARDRALARVLEDWADEALYFHLLAERWSKEHRAASSELVFAEMSPLLRRAAAVVAPGRIYASAIAQGTARLPDDVRREELARMLDDLSDLLRGPFLFGRAISVADLACAAQLLAMRASATPRLRDLLSARPELSAWLDRVDGATRAT